MSVPTTFIDFSSCLCSETLSTCPCQHLLTLTLILKSKDMLNSGLLEARHLEIKELLRGPTLIHM